jgi:hypothetical protein
VLLRFTSLLLLSAVLLPAEVKLPDTPVGKRFARFLQAFNSGDPERLVAFHRETAPDSREARKRAEEDLEARRYSGGVKLYSIARSRRYFLALIVQGLTSGSWMRLEFQVSPEPPHDVVRISPEETAEPVEEAATRPTTR